MIVDCSSASVGEYSEEVGFIVDEMDNSLRPKRTRVLRAADVIPPFDKIPDGTGAKPVDNGQSERATPASKGDDGRTENDIAPGIGGEGQAAREAGPSLAAGEEVPKYDLAENILAEQRRVAAKRRRSPGRVQDEPLASVESGGVRPAVTELLSDDLPELHRIVAEIVAKDIDRLCKRPNR